ncbi:hypothetical protein SOASR015_03880 [Pectobacterium carotovorum subsp. carotovorum]|nr:hypothetical protein SOASR015_03880 [Pectobacterium carotovorum subsp. carotovorum]GLX56463.1 hypothetical protein Pcaca02_17720 [Pectobacterium carotovorum subsp. carotovorum]
MGRLKRRSPHDPQAFGANYAADAVPSVFLTASRAASDAFPTRHWLSRRPVAHSAVKPTAA